MVAISQPSSGPDASALRVIDCAESCCNSALLTASRSLALLSLRPEIIIDNTQCKSLILGMMVEQYLLVRPTADFLESWSTTTASSARM